MFEGFLKMMQKNRKGFTLVELMVVVVIIGILVAIAVPVYNTSTQTAERRAVEANLRIIDGAIMQYYASNENAITLTSVSDLVTANFLQSLPKGPKTATYGITGTGKSQQATVSSTADVGGKTFSTATALSDTMW